MPEDEAIAIRDRIINEIQGMDKLPTGTKNHFVINLDYGNELEPGDSPLVISPGWQAAYDEWDRERNKIKFAERADRNNGSRRKQRAVGQPIEYREGENIVALITPDWLRSASASG